MKNYLIVLITILISSVFFSCTNIRKEESKICTENILSKGSVLMYKGDTTNINCIIKNNVENYLSTRLKDPDSYQSIKYYRFMGTSNDKAKEIRAQIRSIEEESNDFNDNQTLLEEIDAINSNPELDSLYELLSNEKPIGYELTHRFRAKNSYGAYDINEYFIYFDTNLNVIDMKENELIMDFDF